jgi:hypothetical protein
MGRASRDKWNRRLHLLAREEAERRRSDEQRAQQEAEGAGPSFSPVSFWTDWFRQTAKAGDRHLSSGYSATAPWPATRHRCVQPIGGLNRSHIDSRDDEITASRLAIRSHP